MLDLDDVLAMAGRLLLAAIFLASAFGKITHFDSTTQYMAAHGMPLTSVLLVGAIVVELLGGLLLIVGWQARWGAAALAGFLIAATWIFHSAPDQRIHLLKNLAILGGLFQVVAFGSGRLSLEGRGFPFKRAARDSD